VSRACTGDRATKIVGCWQLGRVLAENFVGPRGLEKKLSVGTYIELMHALSQLANKLRVAKNIGDFFQFGFILSVLHLVTTT
jgi:hypothetical protein